MLVGPGAPALQAAIASLRTDYTIGQARSRRNTAALKKGRKRCLTCRRCRACETPPACPEEKECRAHVARAEEDAAQVRPGEPRRSQPRRARRGKRRHPRALHSAARGRGGAQHPLFRRLRQRGRHGPAHALGARPQQGPGRAARRRPGADGVAAGDRPGPGSGARPLADPRTRPGPARREPAVAGRDRRAGVGVRRGREPHRLRRRLLRRVSRTRAAGMARGRRLRHAGPGARAAVGPRPADGRDRHREPRPAAAARTRRRSPKTEGRRA